MVSSLPPSSPLSTSSKAFNVDDAAVVQDPEMSTASDPFGFLAVERKLKLLREQYRPSPKPADGNHSDDNDSIEDLYAEDPEINASVIIFPTPQRSNVGTKQTNSSTVNPLLTPHKHKHKHTPLKRKPIASPSHSSTVPSTPSPSKCTGRVRAVDDETKRTLNQDMSFTVDDHDTDAGKENAPLADPKEGKKTRRGMKKARPSTLDPKELAKGLEALLPRRPRRVGAGVGSRAGKVASAKGTVVDSDDDVKDAKTVKGAPKRAVSKRKPPSGKQATTRKAAGKGKAAGKTAGKVEEEEGEHSGLDASEDEQEKLALERQARIEYFRKLEHYVVEKEDVYVV